ncbi:sensor histidine kinase [Paenibacillus sp. HW567]|uniref:sensor histidine kinase n=1 Tax=Paenibacillus sp. HW567 TaxID=1034769 RepID=UPI00037914C4|nr:histidine kinase [Paenibacillus sp. HW567]
MKLLWKKMSIRWKFVWLCSVVLLIQFVVSNMYLYSHSAKLIREQGEALVGKYVSQSKGNTENALNSVVTSANLLAANEKFQQYLRKYAVRFFEYDNAGVDFQFDCVNTFRNMITQTGYIREIRVHLEGDTFMLSQSSYSNQQNKDIAAFDQITASPRATIGWHAVKEQEETSVYYRLTLNAIGKTSGIRGWVDIIVRPSAVFQSINSMVPAGEGVRLFVIEKNGDAVYSTQQLKKRSLLDGGFISAVPRPGAAYIQSVLGTWIMVQVEGIEGTDWQLLSSIPKENFRLDLWNYLRTGLFILLVPIILLAVVILFLTGYMLRPLKQLVAVMSSVSESQATPQIVTDSLDEFGLLANRFNKMMRRIEEQIMTIRETERLKREAEIGAFQSQIRQHFLYNTLALISWTARKENAWETERISKRFARYYRLALGKGETCIPLEQEVELIDHYLEIQRCRFVDQLEYEIGVETPISEYKLMRSMLQPIVENAVEHGVLPKEQGKVLVLIKEEGEHLVICVMDDGAGAEPERVQRINQGKPFDGESGFSLHSIKKTLYSYYEGDAVFEFQSAVGSGTTVTIKLLKARIGGN